MPSDTTTDTDWTDVAGALSPGVAVTQAITGTSVSDVLSSATSSLSDTGDKFVYIGNALLLFVIGTAFLAIGLFLMFGKQIFGVVAGGKIDAITKVVGK